MTKNVQALLDEYPVFELSDRKKLRCKLTGHEVSSNFDQLAAYVKSAKFDRAWRIHQIMENFGEYFDDISPVEFGCKLTMKIVAKNPDNLLRHVNGKKFKRCLEKGLLILIFW
ncbi:unnamed protein product [Thelazia callipaeda]|uniref:Uncharacterized protein n=1 Tax=Thelazia callipaeda TaxID=103827 RepID=A0A0N5D7B4_THECL|nr:unnamed protein product [Thelazia callipaeda]